MYISNYVRSAVALALAVGLLPTTSEAISLTVDCTTETIAAALDDVTIQGDGNDTVEGQLSIYAARRIKIQDLTITGGLEHGITAAAGASFTALRLLIQDVPGAGVILTANASGLVDQVTIHGAIFGVTAGSNSHVDVNNSVIEEISENGAEAFDGGSTVLDHVTIQGAKTGIFAGGNAYLAVSASTIQNNLEAGISLHRGADALLTDSTIQNNGGIGLGVDTNCSAIGDHLTIKENGGVGVSIERGSSGVFGSSTIENNGEVGIQVSYSSAASLDGNTIQATANPVSVGFGASAQLSNNVLTATETDDAALDLDWGATVRLAGGNTLNASPIGYAIFLQQGSTLNQRSERDKTIGPVYITKASNAELRNIEINGNVTIEDHSLLRLRNLTGDSHVTVRGNTTVSQDSGLNFVGSFPVKVVGDIGCLDQESSLSKGTLSLSGKIKPGCTGY